MSFIEQARGIVGEAHLLTGTDTAGYSTDFTGKYTSKPLCVLRPANTAEVSALLKLASAENTPIVPISGNTGLSGGTHAQDAALLSLERLNAIREIRPEAGIAVVESGVILERLHEAAAEHGLVYPLTFGAQGSAMIGGTLSTNAGGSNVVRYGNARALCLGVEVVLADGRVMDLMSELHKDNTGYALRDLFIGAEGTLGIITAAVLKLSPMPAAYATAMVAMDGLSGALALLNRLQTETGGAVEAFELMPGDYMRDHAAMFPDRRPAFNEVHEVNIMVELGATSPRDATPGPDGEIPVVALLEEVLADEIEAGRVLDAVIAQNESQRREMWHRREDAAEVMLARKPTVITDISVALDRVAPFLDQMSTRLPQLDPDAEARWIGHLGDGNLHYHIYPKNADPAHLDHLVEAVEEVSRDLGGSFSAEHGIGLSKKPSMARRKDPVALDTMRAIKVALDPKNILNPGKVLPK